MGKREGGGEFSGVVGFVDGGMAIDARGAEYLELCKLK